MLPEDLEAVAGLDRRSFTSPWSLATYRAELLENDFSHLWVAEDSLEQKIVGALVAWLVLDEAQVGTIAVAPEYRRQGIARALLTEAFREMKHAGGDEIFLEVRQNNVPAQNLYQSFGFEVVTVRKKYYSDNDEDALIMRARL